MEFNKRHLILPMDPVNHNADLLILTILRSVAPFVGLLLTLIIFDSCKEAFVVDHGA